MTTEREAEARRLRDIATTAWEKAVAADEVHRVANMNGPWWSPSVSDAVGRCASLWCAAARAIDKEAAAWRRIVVAEANVSPPRRADGATAGPDGAK